RFVAWLRSLRPVPNEKSKYVFPKRRCPYAMQASPLHERGSRSCLEWNIRARFMSSDYGPARRSKEATFRVWRQFVSLGQVPQATLELVHLRVSRINGCGACVDSGSRMAKKANVADERLFTVEARRHAPYFSDTERAALALGEAETRLGTARTRCRTRSGTR